MKTNLPSVVGEVIDGYTIVEQKRKGRIGDSLIGKREDADPSKKYVTFCYLGEYAGKKMAMLIPYYCRTLTEARKTVNTY